MLALNMCPSLLLSVPPQFGSFFCHPAKMPTCHPIAVTVVTVSLHLGSSPCQPASQPASLPTTYLPASPDQPVAGRRNHPSGNQSVTNRHNNNTVVGSGQTAPEITRNNDHCREAHWLIYEEESCSNCNVSPD